LTDGFFNGILFEQGGRMDIWHLVGLNGLSRRLGYGWAAVFVISLILLLKLHRLSSWAALLIIPLALSATVFIFWGLKRITPQE
jgi:hypothetical protein